MAWTAANPVSIGDATKKSHYDNVFDNADWIYNNMAIKAWIQFDGTGVIAIQDSFNVFDITDNGVGSYIVVWDTDFANDDYALSGMAGDGSFFVAVDTITTAQINIRVFSDAGVETDRSLIHIIAIGDQ